MNTEQEKREPAAMPSADEPAVSWVDSSQPAAIERGREVVVLYGIDPGSRQGRSLLGLLAAMAIPVRLVAPDQLNQTVAFCAAIPDAQAATLPGSGTAPDVQMMLMRDLGDGQINDLLRQIRESEAGPIRLKAVVTAHNQSWTLIDLIRELEEEHAMMGAYTRLRQSMQLAESWLAAADDEAEASAALRDLLSQATALVSGTEPPPVDSMLAIDRAIRERL